MISLPEFDTGKYEGCEFLMSGGNGKLTIYINEIAPFAIVFHRIRWHEFTALYNCSVEQISSSYFKLIEVSPSPQLDIYIKNDSSTRKAYKELHHYRIYLDETGCHEVFAESATTQI